MFEFDPIADLNLPWTAKFRKVTGGDDAGAVDLPGGGRQGGMRRARGTASGRPARQPRAAGGGRGGRIRGALQRVGRAVAGAFGARGGRGR